MTVSMSNRLLDLRKFILGVLFGVVITLASYAYVFVRSQFGLRLFSSNAAIIVVATYAFFLPVVMLVVSVWFCRRCRSCFTEASGLAENEARAQALKLAKKMRVAFIILGASGFICATALVFRFEIYQVFGDRVMQLFANSQWPMGYMYCGFSINPLLRSLSA